MQTGQGQSQDEKSCSVKKGDSDQSSYSSLGGKGDHVGAVDLIDMEGAGVGRGERQERRRTVPLAFRH
jgi:hypothetical protein